MSTAQIEIAGRTYGVEPTGFGVTKGYKVTSDRASWRLYRSRNGYLFAVNINGSVCEIRGVKWFSDKTGELKPARLI